MKDCFILITFVGAHDPFNPDGSDGPILSYLSTKSFDLVYLFYTNSDFLRRGRELETIVHQRYAKIEFRYIQIDIETPIDYEEIFRAMSNSVRHIERENRMGNPHYYILTDSGTPQMQTCWVLIVLSGIFSAELIQGIPPKFAGGIYKARKLKFGVKDFPIILKPPSFDFSIEDKTHEESLIESHTHITEHYWKSLIGYDNKFVKAKRDAVRISKYDINVLLYGETGSGKELFARLIHSSSLRKEKAFVPVNCSTISPQIAESELFGHRKGSFTGAISDREGLFSIANGGTVFLDEIGDLPVDLQPKLLRVLESGTFIPVGGDKELHTDIRVIAATHRNLDRLVDEGKFRLDLLMRLREYTLSIPSLRDRRNDIPILIKYFVDKWNNKYGEKKSFDNEVMSYLVAYPWPGNVRELKNTVIAMCASSSLEDKITPYHLPPTIKGYFKEQSDLLEKVTIPPEGINLKKLLNKIEKEYYKVALDISTGNKTKAAKLLGIQPAAFRKALRERFGNLL
jgi:DNA-binding NtrC family response regulator